MIVLYINTCRKRTWSTVSHHNVRVIRQSAPRSGRVGLQLILIFCTPVNRDPSEAADEVNSVPQVQVLPQRRRQYHSFYSLMLIVLAGGPRVAPLPDLLRAVRRARHPAAYPRLRPHLLRALPPQDAGSAARCFQRQGALCLPCCASVGHPPQASGLQLQLDRLPAPRYSRRHAGSRRRSRRSGRRPPRRPRSDC